MTENPKIRLGDAEYEIPKLAIKQNRVVEPLLGKHQAFFIRASRETGGRLHSMDLSPEQAEDFSRVVYTCVAKGRPDMTWAEFEELPISMTDILVALAVCIEQSGLYKLISKAPPAGEAQPQSEGPSTGTESLPSTAAS